MSRGGENKWTCLDTLAAAAADTDTEVAHWDADEALVAFVRGLGFDDVADAYEAVPKWYA